MMKRTLLACAVSAICSHTYATPFMPMDARGLAMGSTGVASAKMAHIPHYNPSLLSQKTSDAKFGIIFPQFGVNIADEDEMIDAADEIGDEVMPRFADVFDSSVAGNLPDAVDNLTDAADDLVTEIDKASANDPTSDVAGASEAFGNEIDNTRSSVDTLSSASTDLNSALDAITGSPLRARAGLASSIAFTGEKIQAALMAKADVNVSARTLFSGNDQRMISSYSEAASDYLGAASEANSSVAGISDTSTNDELAAAKTALQNFSSFTSDEVQTANGNIRVFEDGKITNDAEDPKFDSTYEIAAIGIAEIGASFAHEFVVDGRAFSLGVTPKLQSIKTYHYVGQMDEDDNGVEAEIEDSELSYNHFNLDIGASFYVDPKRNFLVGVVIKDLIGKDFETAEVLIDGNGFGATAAGQTISLSPKIRAGVAYQSDWFNVAADLDITKNEPTAYEKATQYASVGAEFDAAGWVQLRAGLRSNLVSESNVVSLGAGVSPFGLHMDLALMTDIADPEKEIGVAFETGFYF